MQLNEIEKIEINLLLEAINQRYGYDFRHYAKASIRRRVHNILRKSGCSQLSELTRKVLSDESFFYRILNEFSITVTEMFRDPEVYKTIRKEVCPYLKTYPFIKIWHAGCASGEEVYSLAIVLREEGLYERATIFATDINEAVLQKAKEGIYSIEQIKQYDLNYKNANGTGSFSDYYFARYNSVIMDRSLRKNITFARHNLVTDRVFGEMHFILCRNVLIYFDKTLQDEVLRLLTDSLINGGFLCIGSKESLQFFKNYGKFAVLNDKMKIFRKKI